MNDPICLEAITKKTRWRLPPDTRPVQQPWRWPLSRLGNRDPIVLATYASEKRYGIDLGYIAATFDRQLFVPVYAAQDGEVSAAIDTPTGYAVSIDHGDRTWTTHYAHLSKMFVTACLPRLRRRQYVRAGEVIAIAAKSPVHIRFELWQWIDDCGFVAVEPLAQMKDWVGAPNPVELRAPESNSHQQEAA